MSSDLGLTSGRDILIFDLLILIFVTHWGDTGLGGTFTPVNIYTGGHILLGAVQKLSERSSTVLY